MAVFFGRARGNRIELDGDARIQDGARVEVRPVVPTANAEGAARAALVQDLLAAGLLDQVPSEELAADEPFEPVTAWGRPLSEQIIEERR